ncbi:hypothetical protein HAX54_003855, partial [Datura stramonium]|nr:hypothetical protein [Datura stramonium]
MKPENPGPKMKTIEGAAVPHLSYLVLGFKCKCGGVSVRVGGLTVVGLRCLIEVFGGCIQRCDIRENRGWTSEQGEGEEKVFRLF